MRGKRRHQDCHGELRRQFLRHMGLLPEITSVIFTKKGRKQVPCKALLSTAALAMNFFDPRLTGGAILRALPPPSDCCCSEFPPLIGRCDQTADAA